MGSINKPKILLCWPYHRQHWVSVFNLLKNDFDFVFLNWADSSFEINSYTDCAKTYWLNYKNIQQLVEEIKPDKVVFMGVDNPLTILLNHYCKKKHIPTYMMQHGIFHDYAAYIEEETMARQRAKLPRPADNKIIPERKGVNKKSGVLFFLNSLSFKTIFPFITIFQIELLKRFLKSHTKAYRYTKYSSRRARFYIVFTRFCSGILKIRDGVSFDAMLEVGNQEADEIFKQVNQEELPLYSEKPYYLLIDDPLGEIADYNTNGIFPKEDVNSFHQKLNQFALQNNKRLIIKLHPDSYNSTFFIKDDNVTFVKQANIPNLIKFSSAVFGGTSTLLIPALKLKPACLFKYNNKFELHRFMTDIDYCKVLDYQNFKTEEIIFDENIADDKKKKFTEAYLYSNDQASVNRIKDILLNKQAVY